MVRSKRKGIFVPESLFKDLEKHKGSLEWRNYLRKLLHDSLAYHQLLDMTVSGPQKPGPKPHPGTEPVPIPVRTDVKFSNGQPALYCPDKRAYVRESTCEKCVPWRKQTCEEMRAKGEIYVSES